MREKRARLVKVLLRFYLISAIENLTDYNLKEMLIQKLTQDGRKLGLSITGFFFALTVLAIGLCLTVLETSKFIEARAEIPWLNPTSVTGLVMIGIAVFIFFLIARFIANRIAELRQIQSIAHPIQGFVKPYLEELRSEQKEFINDHAIHVPPAVRKLLQR